MNNSPIVLFVYNRPEHTKLTLEALGKNILSTESDLFIFCDGWKNKRDKKKVEEVRRYLKSVIGFKSIHIFEKEKNYGLANSIISGVTEIVNKYGKVIVLEDDILTSSHFLEYMNDALNFYESSKEVASISGYMYPVETQLPETFFLKLTSSWGWGTWKRAWEFFEPDGKKLLEQLEKDSSKKEFDINNSYKYSAMLKRQIAGLNNSWAIRWYASCFLNQKLTLYSAKSLVQNIGFDGTGTHSSKSDQFDINLNQKQVKIYVIPPGQNKTAFLALVKYFNLRKPTIIERVRRKIIKLFK